MTIVAGKSAEDNENETAWYIEDNDTNDDDDDDDDNDCDYKCFILLYMYELW